jgi:LasA protease
MQVKSLLSSGFIYLAILALLLSACQTQVSSLSAGLPEAAVNIPPVESDTRPPAELPAPQPTRPHYSPGELVDYTAQTGDTLPALAIRFNTSVSEIRQANPFIPQSATTMPPGMPMKIPIYYLPLWGSSYQIIPDSLFINGPTQIGFDTSAFVSEQPGWLKNYISFVSGANRTGPQIVDLVALNFSVSPHLLLALLEYQAGALSQPQVDPGLADYPLGNRSWDHKGLYLQLTWAANLLNHGLAGWRTGRLVSIERADGLLERFDPWLNAATVSLHNYFNQVYAGSDYDLSISENGLALTYKSLFGDPWQADQPHIPGSLTQPDFGLPFEPGQTWAFTGGPHTAWGNAEPYAALDFAPPSVAGGCSPTSEWATAIANGVVVRSETGVVVLDLDGDGDERTGWNIFYLHLGTEGRATVGIQLKKGDPIGHPSCEGGTSTGTHVHIARKYNGEWIPADGVLAFNLDGWIAHNGVRPYSGTLTRFSQTITACECSNQASFIQSGPP